MKINGKHISAGILVLLCFFAIFIPSFKTYRIKKDPVIINGIQVNRIGKVVRTYSLYNFDFSFEVNGIAFFTSSKVGLPKNMIGTDLLLGRKFPVIYQKSNPSNAIILVTKGDFELFDITFPDSLQWLYKK